MYFDQTRCTGCSACRVACKDWFDVPSGEASRLRILYNEVGQWPNVQVKYSVMACYQCLNPVCVDACPEDALFKRDEDGIVDINLDACVGLDKCGGGCLKACPYEAPQFAAETNPKMWKCDFCVDRLDEGQPAVCVGSCPTRALDVGPLDALKKMYGENNGEVKTSKTGKVKVSREDEFFVSKRVNPALVIKPKITA